MMTPRNPEQLFADWLRGYTHLYRPLTFRGQVARAVGEYRLRRALLAIGESGERVRVWPDPRRGDERALYDAARADLEAIQRRDLLGVA